VAKTFRDQDNIVHQVYVAESSREFHGPNWLQCTRENMYSIRCEPDQPVTCFFCLVTRPPVLSR
jgi:hypothetical protein